MLRSWSGRANRRQARLKVWLIMDNYRVSLMKGRFMTKRFRRTRDELEKLFPDIKKAQAKGISYSDVSDLSRIGKDTAKNMYKADSFQEYLALAKICYEEGKQKKLQKKILSDYMSEETELEESLTPEAELPIFNAEKQNEMVMSRLELLGTPYEISLLAKVAEKMGIQNKATINAN